MFEAHLNLLLFVFLLLGTPGPAPLAIAATGAVFGFKKGLMFLLGLVLGFFMVLVIEIWGLSKIFTEFPQVKQYVQWFGLAYVVYLAIKIGSATDSNNVRALSRTPTWLDGFILNVSNPKAYSAVLIIYVQFLLPNEHLMTAYLMTALVCFCLAVLLILLNIE